jgi:hypothetical protein
MATVHTEARIKGFGSIVYCNDAPFDEALSAIKYKNGISPTDIISAKDLAYARMQRGPNHSLSQNGSYVKEGIIYDPLGMHPKTLVRNSIILYDPGLATSSHKGGNEYLLGERLDVYDTYTTYLPTKDFLWLNDVRYVPTTRFGEDERMVWLFEEYAKDYGLFLKDAGVSQTGFYMHSSNTIKSQGQPFADQLWVHRLDDNSDIGGLGRDLDLNSGVRGVRRESAEDSTKNISPTLDVVSPTLDDILNYSKDYISKNSWNDFEKGLIEKYGGK